MPLYFLLFLYLPVFWMQHFSRPLFSQKLQGFDSPARLIALRQRQGPGYPLLDQSRPEPLHYYIGDPGLLCSDRSALIARSLGAKLAKRYQRKLKPRPLSVRHQTYLYLTTGLFLFHQNNTPPLYLICAYCSAYNLPISFHHGFWH